MPRQLMTRDAFLTQLKGLSTLTDVEDARLEAYLGYALHALGQYQPLRYRLVGIPSDTGDDGFYPEAIPMDAIDVEAVFQSESDIKIDFEVVHRATPDAPMPTRQLWLKGITLPSYVGITTYAGLVQDYGQYYYDDQGYSRREARYVSGIYDKFDIVYTAEQTVETLKGEYLTAVKCFVEAEAHRARAAKDENQSDIVDRGPSGESTTFRNSKKSENSQRLANAAMDEWNRIVVFRPFFNVAGYGEVQKLWSPGEIT